MVRGMTSMLVALVLAATVAAPVQAQDFPSRPITIVVPFPPGGAAAIIPQIVAETIRKRTGTAVVVENKPGAGSLVGTLDVARAPKDGYRLLMLASTLPAVLALRKDAGVTTEAFTPIARMAKDYFVLVGGPATDVPSLKELAAYAKQNPGRLKLGTPGVGTTLHLGAEAMAKDAGFTFNRVDYQGMTAIYNDLLGGRVEVLVDVLGNAMRYQGQNKVRVMAVAAPERVEVARDVPTLREYGLQNAVMEAWWGIAAPAGTPADRIAFLEKAILDVANDEEAMRRITGTGTIAAFEPGRVMREQIETDLKRWTTIVREAGIKVD